MSQYNNIVDHKVSVSVLLYVVRWHMCMKERSVNIIAHFSLSDKILMRINTVAHIYVVYAIGMRRVPHERGVKSHTAPLSPLPQNTLHSGCKKENEAMCCSEQPPFGPWNIKGKGRNSSGNATPPLSSKICMAIVLHLKQ